MGLLWDTPEERRRKEAADTVSGLLGSAPRKAIIAPFGDRMNVMLQGAQEGSGYRGSDRGVDAQQQLLVGAMRAGYTPEQARSLLSPQQGAASLLAQTNKPTSFAQNFKQYQNADDGTRELMREFKKSGSQTINVGTNMKPPTGYRFLHPNDPQNSPVVPIPGGPATRGTGEQQKKISAFEGIRGMVNAMQQGLRDGVNPNSLGTTTTGMLKGVPVLAGIWEGFNGDAKKQAVFLNETENFGNTALQIMRGAQVGPAEQDRFERSLPTKGMTAEQYENALNTSIRIFNDSMRSTIGLLGGNQEFNPISTSDLFSQDNADRLEELRRKRDGAN